MDIGGAEPGQTGEGGESSSSPDFPWPFGSGRDSGTRSTGREEPQEDSTQHAVSFIGLDLCYMLSLSDWRRPMSLVMRKPAFCISENKDAYQLHS